MSVEIKEVSGTAGLQEIALLADEIWHECFVGIISSGQIDYMVEKFQSFRAMTEQTEQQGYKYLAVRDDGELCGYIGIKPETDDRLFLSKLYLRKDKRGHGTASLMLGRVFEEAGKIGKKRVYLTVNKHNVHAVDVYVRKGFVQTAEAVTDIGGGYVMDDFIMEYTL
ncbi:MAG: GNAT family N-acetyltransferase [Ruminococcus sp.]|nr:GNAT family N-acetyltransferase [Ruminococcus sp.]MDE7226380.1 GNAT family N-acetyltransferase [Ruminococcus sp.]